MKIRLSYALAAATAAFLPQLLLAQPTAHYVPGLEGLKGASLPPPGFYLRDYNLFYMSSTLHDSKGHSISAADPELFVYAQAPRLLWITDLELLGGSIGFDALVPFLYTELEANTPGGRFNDSTFAMGDLFAEVTWSKHVDKFDFALGYGAWMPTGESSPGLTTDAGQGYWTHMFTAGLTWYPDQAKQWSVSLLNRYEINTEKEDTDITPGQAWTLEGGIGRVLFKGVEGGVIGYYQHQTTGDSGDGSSDERDRVAGIGPELNMFCSKLGISTSVRYAYEIMAESRMQGHTVCVTFTKRL